MSASLRDLVDAVPGARLVRGDPALVVERVGVDSREAAAGAAFVAVPGFTVDGHSFVAAAMAAGSPVVVVQRDRAALVGDLPGAAAVVEVDDTRAAAAHLAAAVDGYPSRELVVLGITGTDGKTTTSYLATSVLEAAGAKVGRLGTVDAYVAGESASQGQRMTTPEAPHVQRLLRRMVEAGCDFAVVESTSHGLELHRLDAIDFDAAVFTNITGDHLDFHRTFGAYRDAKGRLFAALDSGPDKGPGKWAVVNRDDPSWAAMLARTQAGRPLRYGLDARDLDVTARNVALRADGSSFRLVTPAGFAETEIRLPALFNVANALAAASAGYALGLDARTVAEGLGRCEGVPGRMERIAAGQPFEVIVDYAHTGEAVRKVIAVLREVCRGQLIVVAGAAGERDPGRRFGVGRAAAEGADFSIFTNEDPRSEDPTAIVAEIGRHAEGAGRRRGADFLEIPDRREAIAEAVRRARPGDVVVICGKGHEQSIVYGREAIPWDDREVTREELVRAGYGEA